ncbi:MAG: adenosylcobinamide-GDP ribazoletransferase [Thiotrichales bacterium]|nr:adenosylcobinamide-GDP ribazoletransferase [Thiotrichales bacterium]
MKRWATEAWQTWRLSLQFFSRLPVGQVAYCPERQVRILRFLPAVGALFALLTAALTVLVTSLDFISPFESAFIVLVFWVWLSGALHLDGLADSADAALGTYRNPERALQIMHDSRIGSAAAVALVLLLLGKWLLLVGSFTWLAASPTLWLQGGAIWLAILMMARLLPLALIRSTPCASTTPAHQAMFTQVGFPILIGHLVLISALLVWVSPWALLLWLPWMGLLLWQRRFALRLLGGVNGDLLGLSIETAELCLLLCALWLVRSGALQTTAVQ